jgi:hypothetical protein
MAFGCILASRTPYRNAPTASGFPEAVDTRVHDVCARVFFTDDFL